MTGIILSPKDIFDQDFKRSMRGYDSREVDEFLDDVIKDYESFMAQIQALKKENEALKAELENKETVVDFPPESSTPYQSSYGSDSSLEAAEVLKPSGAVTNFDILKRISRLEKEVFGKQIVE